AGEALGRADLRCLVAEHFTDGLELGHVAHRGGSAVGVEVVDGAVDGGQGLLHAAYCAFAARGYHVVAVGGGAVANHFGVDLGAAGQACSSSSTTTMPPPPAMTKPSRLAS